ncbi:MAG TPA: alpha-hydroxy-acid oxidizing protein, partial [Nocardioidaceae bacterium]|nr:alpha-hydroxy-acid oxidizing protein [Nocardioidaceae bacterium]
MSNFSDHQIGIYLSGMLEGKTPEITTQLGNLEEYAREVLAPEAMGYIVPSAGTSATTTANRAAFDNWRIVPRMLRGSTQRDYSTTVLGTSMPAPVMFAPVGVQTLAHPEGELASARAAAALGLTFIHSTAASHSIEEVADASGDGSRWFQLYWVDDREIVASLIKRAKENGYTTLVLTLDTVLLGYRPADLDRGFLPFLSGQGLANIAADPVFRASIGDADP